MLVTIMKSTVLHLIVIEIVLFFLVMLLVLGLAASWRSERELRRARRKLVPFPEQPRRAA